MRLLGIGIVFFIVAGFAIQPALSQPSIEMDSVSYDFGVSYPNQFLKHDFILWNRGDEPLEIIKVSTTCGCAAAILSATTVLPSASSICSVTVITSSPRKKKESATLTTNDPRRPRVTLEVETDVRNLWTLTPKSSFLFTEVPFDSEQSMQLMLKNVENDEFKVKATSVKESELSVEVGEKTGDGVPITVTVKAGKEKKIINDQVLVLTDHEKQPKVSIPVFGRIVGYIRFNRPRVFFGTMYAGETKKIEISAKLLNAEKAPELKILDIQSEPNVVDGTTLGMRGDGQLRIELSYQAPEKPGYQTGMITFKTNVEQEAVTEIPFSALVRPKK